MVDRINVIVGDIGKVEHQQAMLTQLDLYMRDPMGGQGKLTDGIARQVIDGLLVQPNYVLFLALCNGEYAGVANCFVNFSTFKGKQLINIHDFSVSPTFRGKGIGQAMMEKIFEYAVENKFCKVNLEVREDNIKARSLYLKMGFKECNPVMDFWERVL